MTTSHEQVETPGWDTKLRCSCGFEAATKREIALHLEQDEDTAENEEIAHAIDTAIAYIEAGGDWEDQGQTVVVAALLVADLERIPAEIVALRERETALAAERDEVQAKYDQLFDAVCQDRDEVAAANQIIERLRARETALTAALAELIAGVLTHPVMTLNVSRAAYERARGVLNDN